jgi:hypothetical protein
MKDLALNVSPLCLYRLSDGMLLFSETVSENGQGYRFDMDRTAIVLLVQGEQGPTFQVYKASASPLAAFSRTLFVQPGHVLSISDVGNLELLELCRRIVSGIEIAKGPRR